MTFTSEQVKALQELFTVDEIVAIRDGLDILQPDEASSAGVESATMKIDQVMTADFGIPIDPPNDEA